MANKSDYIIRKTFGPNVIKNHLYNDRAKSIKDVDVIPPPTGLGSAGTAFMDDSTIDPPSSTTTDINFEMDDITNESRVIARRFGNYFLPFGSIIDEDPVGSILIGSIILTAVGFSDNATIGTSGIPYFIGNTANERVIHFETMMDTWVDGLDGRIVVVPNGFNVDENRTLSVSHNLIDTLRAARPLETINTYQDFLAIPGLTNIPRLNILDDVQLTISLGPRFVGDNEGSSSAKPSIVFDSPLTTTNLEWTAAVDVTDTIVDENIETITNTFCPLFPAFDDNQDGCLGAGGDFESITTVSTTPEYTEINAARVGADFNQRAVAQFSSPFVNDAGSNDGLVTTTSITTRTVTRRNVISSFEASEVGRGNLVRVHHSGSTRIGFAPTPTITFSEIERMIQLTGTGDVCITATDEFIHAEIDTSIVRLEILDITE